MTAAEIAKNLRDRLTKTTFGMSAMADPRWSDGLRANLNVVDVRTRPVIQSKPTQVLDPSSADFGKFYYVEGYDD